MAGINYDDGVGLGDVLGTAAIAGLSALAAGKGGRYVYKNVPLIAQDTLYDYFKGGGKQMRQLLRAPLGEGVSDLRLSDNASQRMQFYNKLLEPMGYVDEPAAFRSAKRVQAARRGRTGGGAVPKWVNVGTDDNPIVAQETTKNVDLALELGVEPATQREVTDLFGNTRVEWDNVRNIWVDPETGNMFVAPLGAKRPTTPSQRAKDPLTFKTGKSYSSSLSRTMRGLNYARGIKPEDAKSAVRKGKVLKKGARVQGIETVKELDNPKVVEAIIDQSVDTMSTNWTNVMRAQGFDMYDSLGSNPITKQLGFLREFRNRLKYRQQVKKDLVKLVPVMKGIVPNKTEEELAENLAKAFGTGTANTDGAGAMARLERAIIHIKEGKAPLPEKVTLGDGTKAFLPDSDEGVLLNRMVELLKTGQSKGYGAIFPENLNPGLEKTTKVRTLINNLIGRIDLPVADRADLIAAANLSGDSRRVNNAVINALFDAEQQYPGEISAYEALVQPALDQALTTGQLGRVRRFLGGNKSLFDYQGAFQDRARDYSADVQLSPKLMELIAEAMGSPGSA